MTRRLLLASLHRSRARPRRGRPAAGTTTTRRPKSRPPKRRRPTRTPAAAATSRSRPIPSGAISFDQTELTAPAGEVTIELVNESGIPHNVEVEGNGVEEVSETITEGSTELTA